MPKASPPSMLFTKGRRKGKERVFPAGLPGPEGLEANLTGGAAGVIDFVLDENVASKTIRYRFPGPVTSSTPRGVTRPTGPRAVRASRAKPTRKKSVRSNTKKRRAPGSRPSAGSGAGKRKGKPGQVRKTKTGRPFTFTKTGRARFISEAEAKRLRKRR